MRQTVLLITLVGEQPIPNLLPVRYLKPESVLYICTEKTRPVGERLIKLSPEGRMVIVQPYDIARIDSALEKALEGAGQVIVNLTGGTKPMCLAAYQFAARHGFPILYIDSEKRPPRLQTYQVEQKALILEEDCAIPAVISADDYLRAHLPGYQLEGFSREGGHLTDGGLFEKTVHDTLKGHFDELLAGVRPEGVAGQIEIDLIVRSGNRVAIAEVKLGDAAGKGPKAGLDQLNTAAGREYLGIYAGRVLVTGRTQNAPIRRLASARGIHLVELPGYIPGHALSREESKRLVSCFEQAL